LRIRAVVDPARIDTVVLCRQACAVLAQQAHHLELAQFGRPVQRRLSTQVARVDELGRGLEDRDDLKVGMVLFEVPPAQFKRYLVDLAI